jgi:hypothetical protein
MYTLCHRFTFYKNITSIKVANFKIYYHTNLSIPHVTLMSAQNQKLVSSAGAAIWLKTNFWLTGHHCP